MEKHCRVINAKDLDDSSKGAVCALGVFDGVHLGHQKLINDCIEMAKKQGVPSVIFTFDIDPEEIFNNINPRKLVTNFQRIMMLSELGADFVVVQTFDQDFSKLSPEEFVETTLSKIEPTEIFVGCDFRYGYKASGDVGLLKSELAQKSCGVCAEDLLLASDGIAITASRIRDYLELGKVEIAAEMLGRMHFITSEVLRGRQVGRTLGYPTANLQFAKNALKICDGVYAGYVYVDDMWHRAAISVGVPKTFGDVASTVEAHIIDFDKDIYGQVVTACFAKYLRPMVRFSSTDELVAQIAKDDAASADLPDSPVMPFPSIKIAKSECYMEYL